MITRIFWTVFTLEFVASILLLLSVFFPGRYMKSGPEGPVGGIVLFIPPILLAILAGIVLAFKTDAVKLSGLYFMVAPFALAALSPLFSVFQNYQTNRSMQGDNDFRKPAQRKLAHAIKAADVALVKSLIPQAGDLNKRYNGETLLRFAVYNAEQPGAQVEIVKALLDGGADPNFPAQAGGWPLIHAIYRGPELTELLLKAGADPNRLDSADRPLWWDALTKPAEDGLPTLLLLLGHGADLKLRHPEGGAIGWAAHFKNWPAVWLLMERGVEWKNEKQFGQPLVDMVAYEYNYNKGAYPKVPEELGKIMAKLTGAEPNP